MIISRMIGVLVIRIRTTRMILMVLIMITIIRRTEGTEEQGVSDPGHLSFLAS